MPDIFDAERIADTSSVLSKLQAIIRRLKTVDRDVLLLYLEGFEASDIAEVVGISPSLVAQKVHRTKKLLKRHILLGESDVH
jgi:RNA polymerase sigma-70 factor (ECF subfamily)